EPAVLAGERIEPLGDDRPDAAGTSAADDDVEARRHELFSCRLGGEDITRCARGASRHNRGTMAARQCCAILPHMNGWGLINPPPRRWQGWSGRRCHLCPHALTRRFLTCNKPIS